MIRKPIVHRRDRRNTDSRTPSFPADTLITGVAASGSDRVNIAFNGPVTLLGTPTTWFFNGHLLLGVTPGTYNAWEGPIAGTVATADTFTVSANDPAARTSNGGYVAGTAGAIT